MKLLLLISAASISFGATLIVNNAGPGQPGCPPAAIVYLTIQGAVNAAIAGDTVYVCVGNAPYNQQVVINKNLILAGQTGATLRPAPMVANTTSLSSGAAIAAAVLVVAPATSVTVAGLIVDGSGNGIGGCAPNLIGIYYRNASGTAAFNAVRNFRLGAGLEGCQSGSGIFAQSGGGGTSTLLAYGNSVSRFQKTGIFGNETGTTLNAVLNVVTGLGPTPHIAQNGIQIGFGAVGGLSTNTIANVIYSLCTDVPTCPASSTGILIFQPGGAVTTFRNNVGATQTGVFYFEASNGTINYNNIWNTLVYDGVAISGGSTTTGTSNTVDHNTITDSSEAAVYIDTNSNTVTNNTLNEAPIGIWFAAGTGNTQSSNTFYNIPVPVQGTPVTASRARPVAKPSPLR